MKKNNNIPRTKCWMCFSPISYKNKLGLCERCFKDNKEEDNQ